MIKIYKQYISRLFDGYRGLPKSIYAIFAASIVNSMGNFVYPFLAIFLTGNLGYSNAQAGDFVLFASAISVPGALLGGKLADMFGRKKVAVAFQSLTALSFALCPLFYYSFYYLFDKAAGFFSNTASPAYSAMTADLTNASNRKAAFSLQYLGINIGFAVGPTIAGILYEKYISMIFLLYIFTTVLSVLLIMIYVKETIGFNNIDSACEEINEKEKAEDTNVFEALLKRPNLILFSIISAVYSFVYAQHGFSLPIYMTDIFSINGAKFYGILMSTNAITVVLLTTILTRLTLKLNTIYGIVAGGFFLCNSFGDFFCKIPFGFNLTTITWTIGEILVTTNSGVFIANNTPSSHRGRFNAILPFLTRFGSAVAPAFSGKLIDRYGTNCIWPFSFLLAVAASLMMLILRYIENLKSKGA